MNPVTKIAVVGGGPIGLAAAVALSRLTRLPQMSVTLVERTAPVAGEPGADIDHRVYALSPRSRDTLMQLGAWPESEALLARVQPVHEMHVFSDAEGGVGDTEDAGQNLPTLPEVDFATGMPVAWMIEHKVLMAGLMRAFDRTGLPVKTGAVVAMEPVGAVHGGGRCLHLDDGTTLQADLVVAADGRYSSLRALAGIDVVEKDYQSLALVANFETALPHTGSAMQWFTHDAVLAYLPLPGNMMSIVWSVANEAAASLRALDDGAFAEAVAAAGHHRLGALTLRSPREAIALKRIEALDWVAPGFALIGDAAHAIHPLAGQGANLGFGDVEALVKVLDTRGPLGRAGDIAVLRRYQRERREAAALMAETTDGLHGLYRSDRAVSKWLRRKGFGWFGRQAWARELAAGYAARA